MAAEIISLATMLTGAGSGVLVPFVNKLLGPFADELGVAIAEHARIYRLSNTFKLFQRAKEMTAKAGFDPKQVNMKTLLPLIEGASLEEDENLMDKWAALLANAANPESEVVIKPIYADIIRQLTIDEVRVLDQIFVEIKQLHPSVSGKIWRVDGLEMTPDEQWKAVSTDAKLRMQALQDDYGDTASEKLRFKAVIDGLLRQRLLVAANKSEVHPNHEYMMYYGEQRSIPPFHSPPEMNLVYLTTLGFEFMIACTPPDFVQSSAS